MYKLIQGSSIGVIVSINTYLHIYLKHSILIIHFNVVYLHRTSNVSADEIGFSRLICRTIFSASQRNTRSFSNRVALKISSDWVWKVPSLFRAMKKTLLINYLRRFYNIIFTDLDRTSVISFSPELIMVVVLYQVRFTAGRAPWIYKKLKVFYVIYKITLDVL